jgi:hypothetical protein
MQINVDMAALKGVGMKIHLWATQSSIERRFEDRLQNLISIWHIR